MRTVFVTVVVAALAFGGAVSGQVPSVPDGDGAWTVQITTSGGFTGRGRGNVTVTSQGTLTCLQTLTPCDNKLVDQKLRPVAQLVSSFDTSKWVNLLSQNMVCNDCYTTLVTFARREGGNVKITTLFWNDVTQNKVPPDVVKFAEMALTGKW